MSALPIITNSQIGTYLGCARKFWWSYELAIRPERKGTALSIGTAYHAALERINRGLEPEPPAGLDEPYATIVACMIAGWRWRWANTPIGKVVAAEMVFQFRPSRARFIQSGKIDSIQELPDGRLAVVEYKTCGEDLSPQSNYWRRLNIDRQISIYMLGARALGYPVETVVYDASRKPGMRPYAATPAEKRKFKKDGTLYANQRETDEPLADFAERLTADIGENYEWYYGRQEIPRLESDLEQCRAELSMFAEQIRTARRTGRWPRNTDSCRRHGLCPYFNPCTNSHDPQAQGVPSGFRVAANVNEELEIEDETGE